MNPTKNHYKIAGSGLVAALLLSSCGGSQKAYNRVSMTGSREVMTEAYAKKADKDIKKFVSKYKQMFDQEMKVEVGVSDQEMVIGKPESLLTNFTADRMKEYADERTQGNCDLAIMNVHGHRAALPKGPIMLENIYEIYSFDNRLVILKLKGSDLLKVFESIVRNEGAGVSANVRITGSSHQLLSATVDNRQIYPEKTYNVVTLDYLADGNDGMDDMKKAVSVEQLGLTLRDMMIGYVKKQAAAGNTLRSTLDGRIIISRPVTP